MVVASAEGPSSIPSAYAKASARWAPFFSRFAGEDVTLRPRTRWALTAAFGASGPIGFAAGAFWGAGAWWAGAAEFAFGVGAAAFTAGFTGNGAPFFFLGKAWLAAVVLAALGFCGTAIGAGCSGDFSWYARLA